MVEAAAAKVTVAGSKSGTILDPLKWLIRLGSGWFGLGWVGLGWGVFVWSVLCWGMLVWSGLGWVGVGWGGGLYQIICHPPVAFVTTELFPIYAVIMKHFYELNQRSFMRIRILKLTVTGTLK
jgi:hypothetical protein